MATSTVAPHGVKTSLPPGAYRPPLGPLGAFLGLFSLGLGLTELLKPHSLGDAIGVRHPSLLQVYGIREMTSGIGILAGNHPAPWLWSRVAGDVMDLATLAAAYSQADEADRNRVLIATAAVVGVTVLDILSAENHMQA